MRDCLPVTYVWKDLRAEHVQNLGAGRFKTRSPVRHGQAPRVNASSERGQEARKPRRKRCAPLAIGRCTRVRSAPPLQGLTCPHVTQRAAASLSMVEEKSEIWGGSFYNGHLGHFRGTSNLHLK